RELGATTGLGVRPEIAVRDLSIAERQRVEFLRVLAIGAKILVLDEPTAVLTDQEADGLLTVIQGLATDGLAIVLITHRLREVVTAADRVSVMRSGRMVTAGLLTAGLDAQRLAHEMTGEAPPPLARRRHEPGAVRLAAEKLHVAGGDGTKAVDGLSLQVRAGEILGVAGVGGNGQQELADALIGLAPVAGGRVMLDGVDITGWAVWPRRRRGLHYVPSDRSRLALVGDLSVADNLALSEVRAGQFGWFLLAARMMRDAAAGAIAAFAIAGATPERESRLLSGGNAQKLVLARELHDRVRVLVAHSPTRGLDVAACAFVHGILAKAAAAGAGILLISEDLDEILGLSDRIVVMSRGRIAGERAANPSRAELGALMLGHA
ncbi:MAG: ATP-binding cassette domain-containing protein, partial [Geminicoccaceae bacterium]